MVSLSEAALETSDKGERNKDVFVSSVSAPDTTVLGERSARIGCSLSPPTLKACFHGGKDLQS
jgi:hypothetical protein